MTIDVFGWLRRKAHDAVLGGISDAVQEIAPGESAPADLEGLRRVLAMADVKALTAPTTEATTEPKTAGKRKAK